MNQKRMCSVLFILTLFIQSTCAANVVGYFINWGIYGTRPYTAQDVPYDKLTHIQYAFFLPEIDGTISSSDENADEQILLGDMIWWPDETHDSTTSLVFLAHQKNVKVLASVGGWTGSSSFPALAGSVATRSQFCSSARELIEKYKFDGIDIDWEYPCFTEHNGTPQDAQNFVLLLAQLRDTLDAVDGEHKLITLAISGGSFHGQNFLIEQFHQDVDYISIMTYDYTGAWDEGSAWHNSPLYDYGSSDNWSVNRAMEYYVSRGVPASKFNIGMAFYGHSFTECQGPNTAYTGPGSGEPDEPGMIYYSSLTEKIENGTYTRYWDEQAQVPYCLSGDGEYCSYDDTVSIRLKAEYCLDKGCGGAIIWELKADFLPDGSQPLLDAAAQVLKSPVKISRKTFSKPGRELVSFVSSYSTGNQTFRFSVREPSKVFFTVYDLKGRIVYRVNSWYSEGDFLVSLPGNKKLPLGKYLVNIRNDRM